MRVREQIKLKEGREQSKGGRKRKECTNSALPEEQSAVCKKKKLHCKINVILLI